MVAVAVGEVVMVVDVESVDVAPEAATGEGLNGPHSSAAGACGRCCGVDAIAVCPAADAIASVAVAVVGWSRWTSVCTTKVEGDE